MALDFQQVLEQVRQLGKIANRREAELREMYDLARELLEENARELERSRQKVQFTVQNYEPGLRCALPVEEPLDARFPLPPLPVQATIMAADGSQIAPDRHAFVDYCLINVGAIQMQKGGLVAPATHVSSRLFYDQELYTPTGTLTDATLALMRDLNERKILAEMAAGAPGPVVTFTDGQMELWGGRAGDGLDSSEFQRRLEEYTQVLDQLCGLNVITAGYVDKPAANLVIRLLEVLLLPEAELSEIKTRHPLRGVKDNDLFRDWLEPGDRSAVFAIQSIAAANYREALALHFFYLNVGRPGRSWIARVELPAWVAMDPAKLDHLHAVLVEQCRIMGSRPYPYLLHRAHEVALVSLKEKEQVEQMIALELRRRGVSFGEKSQKQAHKEAHGRTRYK